MPVEQTANLDPHKYAFVVLSDVASLPGSFRNRIARLRARRRIGADRAGPQVGPGQPRSGVRRKRRRARAIPAAKATLFQTAAWLDTGHPSIHNAQHWDDVKFYQAVRINPGIGASGGAPWRRDAAAAR